MRCNDGRGRHIPRRGIELACRGLHVQVARTPRQRQRALAGELQVEVLHVERRRHHGSARHIEVEHGRLERLFDGNVGPVETGRTEGVVIEGHLRHRLAFGIVTFTDYQYLVLVYRRLELRREDAFGVIDDPGSLVGGSRDEPDFHRPHHMHARERGEPLRAFAARGGHLGRKPVHTDPILPGFLSVSGRLLRTEREAAEQAGHRKNPLFHTFDPLFTQTKIRYFFQTRSPFTD